MKVLLWICLLGIGLNLAWAIEATGEEEASIQKQEEREESPTLKFSNLVKSTMDLLGPEDGSEEVSQTDETRSISKSN